MRAAARQQVDDVEVVHVAGKAGQQVGTRDEQHVGQRDLGELLPAAGAVDLGGFIQVRRDVHQDTGGDQHEVRDADPDVDDDDHDPGQGGRTPEVYGRVYDPEIHQEAVEQAVQGEHLAHVQQGDELGDGDGHDEHGPPQLLETDALLVDDHGHGDAQEVVGEGGEEGPDQRPEQDLTEGGGVIDAAHVPGEQGLEVLEPDPVEQARLAAVVGGAVVGEGHQDHEHQGQHREQQDAGQGQGE